MRPGRGGNLTPKMMKQLTCYLEQAGYGSAKAHFPPEVWTIIIQSIDCVRHLPDRYLRFEVPRNVPRNMGYEIRLPARYVRIDVLRNELREMKIDIEEALQAGQAPTFSDQDYELLKHAMRLTDRGWRLPSPEVLARLSFTQAQWDLKDQIGWEALDGLWNDYDHFYIEPCTRRKLTIYLDRFSPEILDRRDQLFELFDSQGFHASGYCESKPPEYYSPYGKGFCWHKINQNWGKRCEIEVIVHPLDMTFWAIAAPCDCGYSSIPCCGSSFGVYPATLAGIQMMCDNVYQAYQAYLDLY